MTETLRRAGGGDPACLMSRSRDRAWEAARRAIEPRGDYRYHRRSQVENRTRENVRIDDRDRVESKAESRSRPLDTLIQPKELEVERVRASGTV